MYDEGTVRVPDSEKNVKFCLPTILIRKCDHRATRGLTS